MGKSKGKMKLAESISVDCVLLLFESDQLTKVGKFNAELEKLSEKLDKETI
ncbi:MAG: hypothetical protein H7A23_10800 [Leptospiraceae bacterium]|nr:hypothetical protein [Leptospiraceae bacterium]MCP5495033.1 hypothetical protein [Leptospiraceae bacterium]